jgi:putative copper export protein
VTPDVLSVTVRALAFIALFQAIGAAFFLAGFARQLAISFVDIRRLALIAASCGVFLVFTHLTLDAARMAGDYSGLWDRELQQLAWSSGSGWAQLTQVAGLLLVLAALRRSAHWYASLGGAIALAGFLLTGHTSAHALRAVLAPLLGLHLLIVAGWFGALAPLLIVIRKEAKPMVALIVARYSAIAGLLVPLIALAGLSMAWLLTGSVTVLRRPYGELLMVKLILFSLLMALAAWNKWRLTPALALGEARAAVALQRSIIAEIILIAVVLSVTAALTSLYSPD